MAELVSFKRDVLDEAVRSLLDRYLNLPVGMSDTPSDNPALPWLVLFQSPSPRAEYGSFAYPEDMPVFSYLVKSAGRNHRETARTSSRVNEALVGRGPNGFLGTLFNTGCDVIDRQCVSRGAIVPSGPELFEVSDIYDLKVAL